jgi:type III restriction enzyme
MTALIPPEWRGAFKDNIGEKYGYWLRAAVQRWKEHQRVYRQLGVRPAPTIIAERNVYADAIGEYLWNIVRLKRA